MYHHSIILTQKGDAMQDPTKKEMTDFLATQLCGEDPAEREFNIEEAIYWFAYSYHGGQWSNLYSALSTSLYSPGPLTTEPEDSFLLDALVAEFGGE